MWSSSHGLHDCLGQAEAVYVGQRCLQTQASSLGAHLPEDESSLTVAIGVDEKALRKWIYFIIYAISDLEDDWVGRFLVHKDSTQEKNYEMFGGGVMLMEHGTK